MGGPRVGWAAHLMREGFWMWQPGESERGQDMVMREDSREGGPDGGAGTVGRREWAATHQPGPGNRQQMEEAC